MEPARQPREVVEELFDILLEGTPSATNWDMRLPSLLHSHISTSFAVQPVLQYAIFPFQFAYLYSYHPSGSMEDLPKALAEKWEAKHVEASEEAFARVAVEGQSVSGPSFFKKYEVATQTKPSTTMTTALAAKKD